MTVHDDERRAPTAADAALSETDGRSLRAHLRELNQVGKRLPEAVVAALGAQAAAVLADAQARAGSGAHGRPLEVGHRDVSPETLFVTAQGHVKVLDSGTAKAADRLEGTPAGVTEGKPPYLSPEQIQGRPADGRSEVFSLGATLWECLVGRHPYDDGGTGDVLRRMVSEPPQDLRDACPGLDEQLGMAVMSALEQDAEARPDAAGLQRSLEHYLHGIGAMNAAEPVAAWLRGELAAVPLLHGGQGGTPAGRRAFGAAGKAPAFGSASETPAFSAPSETPAFSAPSETPAFSAPSETPAFGAAGETPAFGAPSETPAFGAPDPTHVYDAPAPPPTGLGLELDLARAPRRTTGAHAPIKPVTRTATRQPARRPPALWLGLGAVAAVLAAGGLYAVFGGSQADSTQPEFGGTFPLRVESKPQGARIELDGQDTGKVTPDIVNALDVTEHELVLRLEGYRDARLPFTKDQAPGPILVTLAPFSEVTVATAPSGARVFLDGEEVLAATPGVFQAIEGERVLRLELDGYLPVTRTLNVAGRRTDVKVKLQRAAYLDVRANLADAWILLDGEDTKQTTPAARLPVVPGKRYLVAAEKGRARSKTQKVRAPRAGKTRRVTISLVDPIQPLQRKRAALFTRRDRLEAERARYEERLQGFVIDDLKTSLSLKRAIARIDRETEDLDRDVQRVEERIRDLEQAELERPAAPERDGP